MDVGTKSEEGAGAGLCWRYYRVGVQGLATKGRWKGLIVFDLRLGLLIKKGKLWWAFGEMGLGKDLGCLFSGLGILFWVFNNQGSI